jgi:hypothetical protein
MPRYGVNPIPTVRAPLSLVSSRFADTYTDTDHPHNPAIHTPALLCAGLSLDVYTLAAHYDILSLAVPTSAHLLAYPLSRLDDQTSERKGAMCLKWRVLLPCPPSLRRPCVRSHEPAPCVFLFRRRYALPPPDHSGRAWLSSGSPGYALHRDRALTSSSTALALTAFPEYCFSLEPRFEVLLRLGELHSASSLTLSNFSCVASVSLTYRYSRFTALTL